MFVPDKKWLLGIFNNHIIESHIVERKRMILETTLWRSLKVKIYHGEFNILSNGCLWPRDALLLHAEVVEDLLSVQIL